nr:restriction endonuclease subunit S [Ectothiorhodospira sp. 9100]
MPVHVHPYLLLSHCFTRNCARENVGIPQKQSTNLASISSSNVMSCPLPFPPAEEQLQILSFLNHETARIDALVEEQQRLIELLKEKRQAVISHAVTKGLDPDVPMKDSGVEWLGEVPAHWNVVKFKYLIAEFEQGWSPQCDGDQAETLDEWGVLKVGCVNYGVFDPTENKRLPDNLEPRPELSIRKDDLLISRANTRDLVGSAAHVPMDYPKLMASDKIFVVRLHQRICRSRYAVVYLFGKGVRHQIELQATGASSSMLNIGQGAIRELWIPLPPDSEQDRIVHELEKREADFAALEQETVRHMRILNERRSALISAAVTGKIDVRGWQADQQSKQPEILMAAETRATYG